MIITKINGEPVAFAHLDCGDVFVASASYYMKVNNPNDQNNSVNLLDGDLCHFPDNRIVYMVDYEFNVK